MLTLLTTRKQKHKVVSNFIFPHATKRESVVRLTHSYKILKFTEVRTIPTCADKAVIEIKPVKLSFNNPDTVQPVTIRLTGNGRLQRRELALQLELSNSPLCELEGQKQ